MKSLLSSFVASFSNSSNRSKTANRRRARLTVECMEGRQLMTAMPAIATSHMAPAVQTSVDKASTATSTNTIGALTDTMADSDGATILHISETKFFPTTFPFNASIGGETVQVTGYESTGLGNGGNKDAQGNFVISVTRDVAKTGVQGAATGSLITLLNGPPLTGTVATPPAAPGGFTATAVSSSQINLQWNASAGATEYVIYQWNYTTKKWNQIDTTTNLSYQVTKLATGTEYCFEVAAQSNAGIGTPSNWQALTTLAPPAIPGGFTAKDVSLSQINLQWNASAGATQYLIYQLNATTQQSVQFTTSNLSYQVTNLTANTQYYFYIKASNQTAGPGLWSNPVTATTAPADPTWIHVQKYSSTQDVVTWANVTGAASYQVWYKDGSGRWYEYLTPTIDSWSYIPMQLGVSNTFAIVAISASGLQSPGLNTARFTTY